MNSMFKDPGWSTVYCNTSYYFLLWLSNHRYTAVGYRCFYLHTQVFNTSKSQISSFMIHRGGIYCIEEDDSLRRDVAPKQQIHGQFFFFMYHYVCTECHFFSCATLVGWVNSSYSYKSLPSKWHYLPINLWGITEQWVSQPEDALQLHMFDYSWWQEDYSRYSASRWWRMSDIQ